MKAKLIKDFEDYFICCNGFVISFRTKKPKILKGYVTKEGYTMFNLIKKGKHYTLSSHRLVAEAFIKNPENKLTVNHINGIKSDNNIKNLEWCTNLENIQHAYATGLYSSKKGLLQGSKHPGSILVEADIPNIRDILSKGMTQKSIAKIYNVTRCCIKDIKNSRTCKHV